MSKLPSAKRDELLKLVETCLEMAKGVLTRQASFLPASIAIDNNGKYDIGVDEVA